MPAFSKWYVKKMRVGEVHIKGEGDWEQGTGRGCLIIIWTELNIKTGIVQKESKT